MPHNPCAWFEIYVQDLPRAKTFYEKVLGHDLSPLPTPEGSPGEMLAFPMHDGAGGASGALVKMDGMASTAGGTLIYFGCEDVATEAGRVVEAGGKLMQPKMPIGEYGFIAIFEDVDGNIVGLHSQE
jgi:predicted enzyme related to lactoylglutathione lyase